MSVSKRKFRQASNHCKMVFKAVKLAYGNKTKESIIFLEVVFLTKVNLLCFLYLATHKCCVLHKAKLFAKNLSKNCNDSGISLLVFLKLQNISVTPKMFKNFIKNLNSLKVSGSDCIPVVVLKNCESELS